MLEPGGVLSEIARAKQVELASRFDGVSLDAVRADARPSDHSLARVLARPGARFTLEVKRASPSGGAIRPNADPPALARGYAGVADALSVLCDSAYFGGSLADLAAARAEFEGPILAKDFFIDPRQVAEARIAGADAILLDNMTPEEVREAVGLARKQRHDVLVEVSGGVNLRTVRSYAEASPDLISVGALTHSAAAVDISLEMEPC